jgi:large subunit ribosomal protein L23
MRKNNKVALSAERVYDILLQPVITEKSTSLGQNNQYVFEVLPTASKPEVKVAVETLFKVKVEAVNTLNVQGKTKRFRGRIGRRSDVKKAIVTLKQGDTIDITAGI